MARLWLGVIWVSMASLASGGNDAWPDFRGPGGQGIVPDAGQLPTTWSETENVRWKTPIPGRGWSTPVAAEDKLWMTTATDEGHSLRVIAADARTGAILHDVEVFAPSEPVHINAKNSHASPSPVLADGKVYVHFGTMGTACLDGKTAEILWKQEKILLDHKEGPGSSPIVWKNLLILTCDGMDVQYMAALDRQTGELVWKKGRPLPIHPNPDQCKAYATPLVVSVGGRDELISPGAMQVLSYNPADGEELWRVAYDGFSNVPRPLFHDGMFFICTGYMQPQLWAIRAGGRGDITNSHVVWKYSRQVPANPSPILVDGSIYMTSNAGVISCLDAATGKSLWTGRLGGNYSASPLAADGKIYFASEEGITTVLRPGDKLEKLAENELDGRHMASPIPLENSLILRTDSALYRIESP